MAFSGISGLGALPQYLSVVKNETVAVTNYGKSSATDRMTIARFKKAAPFIRSASDLLDNYNALTVVLGASGLSSLSRQTAVLRKLMTQNPADPKSLAATSRNAAWMKFARAFSNWNPSPFSSDATIANLTQSYLQNQFETKQQTDTPGVGNALYFTRSVTKSTTLSDLMSDSRLLNVIVTVAGFDPKQFGALDYDQQVRLLKPKINLKDFSSPQNVQNYAERYLATLQYKPQAEETPASMLTLYGANGKPGDILSLFGASASSQSLFTALF